MRTNTKVSLVKREVKDRQTSYNLIGTYPAHLEETKGVNVTRTNRDREDMDSIEAYIPQVIEGLSPEDILINNPDLLEIEELRSLKAYQEKYEAYLITTVDRYNFGSNHMRHTRIGAK